MPKSPLLISIFIWSAAPANTALGPVLGVADVGVQDTDAVPVELPLTDEWLAVILHGAVLTSLAGIESPGCHSEISSKRSAKLTLPIPSAAKISAFSDALYPV